MTTDDTLGGLLASLGTVVSVEPMQTLWGGYGELSRVFLDGNGPQTVVVKQVAFPLPAAAHPRGWQSDFSHQRKLTSYQVETAWYQHYAPRVSSDCYCPQPLAVQQNENRLDLVLEDLSPHFPVVPEQIELVQVRVCLHWLAHFHARFLSVEPENLWPTGTYWHLDTRPDEYAAMPGSPLKRSAQAIDSALRQTAYQTLVHGDAKLANFCFSEDGQRVAAVDFQYVGRGCGMKDVVYFMTSCLSEAQCFAHAEDLLNVYFAVLADALSDRLTQTERLQLENDWRALYPLAWADFQRFLSGWSPTHWKLNGYMAEQTAQALHYLHRSPE
ncbi:phosphotransferase [Reinekea blandensis]|uniref:CHK kinase-like domain-containing protein n=1 Tax=Reinekea blandensis MED297 TaxID=314283 RepID=A4BFX4_9GAMM|nr:phosphotransferase [Reinekea blandensis]EAR08992.1 hypothetical protein MED297_03847 [Reinekea sp. MED297] [Reinekea blandensis MED297]